MGLQDAVASAAVGAPEAVLGGIEAARDATAATADAMLSKGALDSAVEQSEVTLGPVSLSVTSAAACQVEQVVDAI